MLPRTLLRLLLPLFLAVTTIAAAPTPWTTPPGFTATRGGEDGRIVTVTTLAATGPGSLAAALAERGPRKIVFAVGGIIDLNGATLRIREPHLTIAGETAPSPGITLIRGGMGVGTHDVIIRHLRIRAGEAGRAKKSGWEIDTLATAGARDVIIDHCSVSWGTDENLSASGDRFGGGPTPDDWRRHTSHRITFHRCLIGEGLRNSTHAKGGHSMGSLIHDNASNIAVIGNLYISNNARNPLFKGGARGVVVNNYIHNPGNAAITFALVPDEWKGRTWERGQMAIVGNVVRRGPSTPATLVPIAFGSKSTMPECDAYLSDNLFFDRKGVREEFKPAVTSIAGMERGKGFLEVPKAPLWPKDLKAQPASKVVEAVLNDVGARPWERDAIDRRLVEEARTGGGKIIDSEAEVGGYPKS